MNRGRQRLTRLTAVEQMLLFMQEDIDLQHFVDTGELDATAELRMPYNPSFLQAWQNGWQ